jgi:hypothetical protein
VKDENLNVITLVLKCVVNCKLVWKKASKALALTMYFPKHTNREQQQQKKFAKALNMFPLNLPSLIHKNA